MRTVTEFVDALRRYHLLEEAQLEQIEQLARRVRGQAPDPRPVAKKLVEQGWLTHFQANQLFKGKGSSLLLGSYVLMDLVGEGGMGAVYKARNWKLGQIVAVKLIRPERLAHESTVRRFEREIRASAQLHHPNIVRALDAGEAGGTHFLVMEHVAGGKDLHKLVRENGPLPVDQACRFAQQIALGLQHAFERGLVHRDIKPHNLLLAGTTGAAARSSAAKSAASGKERTAQVASASGNLTPTVKILDFGLARLGESEEATTLTQEGSMMGTVDYLAPEQARDSHKADIRSDLYSLGCSLYYLLTGQAPFVGGTAAEKMIKHQFEEPTPLTQMRPDAPPVLSDMMRKLMAKRPEDRYQTPAELANDLGAVLAGKPVSVTVPAVAVMPLPTASHPELPAIQALQDTENPFAALSQSDTSADAPVSVRLHAKPAPTNKKKLGLILGGAGGVLALAAVIVVMAMSRSGQKPIEPEPKVTAPKVVKKASPFDQLANEERIEKLRQEEEAKEKQRKLDEEAAEKKRLAALEVTWQQWLKDEVPLRDQRVKDADDAFKALESKAQEKGAAFASLVREVAAFKAKHGGTPSALRAAELLRGLRNPLDELQPAKMPAEAQALWSLWSASSSDNLPGELVAVRGDHRGRQWGQATHVQFAGSDDKLVLSGSGNVLLLMAADTREIVAVLPRADIWTLTPDGKLLAAGSFDGNLVLYDVDARKQLGTIEAFAGGGVRSLAFAPDARSLAAGGGNNRAGNANAGFLVRVFDVATQKSRGTSPSLNNAVYPLAYSPDGTVIAAGTASGQVSLLNPGRLQETTDLLGGANLPGFVFSPDGKTIAVQWNAPKIMVKLFDVGTRKEVLNVDDFVGDIPQRAIFSSDNRAFACRDVNGTVRLWELPSAKLVRQWEAHKEGGIASFAFTSDSKELWTASNWNTGDVAIWDARTGKEIKTMPGYDEATRAVTDLSMPAEGKLVAWLCGGKDVRVWQRDKQAVLTTIRRPDPGPFALSRDGKHVVTGDFNMIRVWDSTTGLEPQPLRGRAPASTGLAFAPDARLLLAADTRGTIHRWQFTPGAESDILQWQCPPGTFNPMLRLAFLPDGQRFVTFGETCHFLRWNIAAESSVTIGTNFYGSALSPNGRWALTSWIDGHVAVWDVDTTKEAGSLPTKLAEDGGHAHRIVDLAVTPDERFALALQNYPSPRLPRLCSLESKQEVFRFKPHQASRVSSSPNGQHFLTTDTDGACTLWDLHTGTLVRRIEIGHPLADLPAAFAPDGKLAAVVRDAAVVLLEMPSGNKWKEWHFPGPVHGVTFAPDSRHLAVANGNGTIYLLRLAKSGQPTKAL